MTLFNLEPLRPDEMMYSWLYRVAALNVISFDDFIEEFLQKRLYIAPEIRCYIPDLLCRLGYQGDSREFFLESSTYTYFSLGMSKEVQGKYLANFFTPNSSFLGNMAFLINDLSVCPKCMEEDKEKYGAPYLHRNHQLGISCCPAHNVGLLKGRFQRVSNFSFDLTNYLSDYAAVTDIQYEYAVFAQKMLELKHSLSIVELKEILRQRCQKRNLFTSKNMLWSSLRFSESRFCSLLTPELITKGLSKLASCKVFSMCFLQCLIMYIYDGDFDDFACDVVSYEKHHKVPLCKKELLAYGITEALSPICGISCFKHSCGGYFWQNNWGASVIGCPHCNSQESDIQRIRNITLRSGRGDYVLLDSPSSVYDTIRFQHKNCGRIFPRRIDRFVFYNTKCSCESGVPFRKAAERVSKCGDFELVAYRDTMHKAIIRHKDCGRTFEIMLHKFTKSPYCRLCDKVIMNGETFSRKVKELTGDNFEIVSDYLGADKRISILHKGCGKVHDYLPYLFIKNCRCAECERNITLKRVKKLLEQGSSGRYTLERYSHRGACYLVDRLEKKKIKTNVSIVYFELLQSTRSRLIVLTDTEETERLKILNELRTAPRFLVDEFLVYLQKNFKYRDYFYTSEIEFKKTTYESIKQMLSKLKKRGDIESVGFAMYRIVKKDV